jgi:hypothetical protein
VRLQKTALPRGGAVFCVLEGVLPFDKYFWENHCHLIILWMLETNTFNFTANAK